MIDTPRWLSEGSLSKALSNSNVEWFSRLTVCQLLFRLQQAQPTWLVLSSKLEHTNAGRCNLHREILQLQKKGRRFPFCPVFSLCKAQVKQTVAVYSRLSVGVFLFSFLKRFQNLIPKLVMFFLFLKHFWRTWVLFVGPLIPLFWTSGDISSRFQSQSGQPYLHLAEVYMLYVPQIYFWCDTCQPFGGQHGSWTILFHIPVRRHCWGLKPGSIMLLLLHNSRIFVNSVTLEIDFLKQISWCLTIYLRIFSFFIIWYSGHMA